MDRGRLSASPSSGPARPVSTPQARCSRATIRAVEVDLIDRLPTPWGLVRLGVAPDHPNIKAVSRAFEKIALRPGFRFLGNVEVGRDVTHEELAEALRRRRLRDRRADRPPARHPRRGSPGLLARDRVRRLVQRPPRLPGPRVRPLARAGGRDRQRERRARRRADARPDARGARADRHDRRGDRGDQRRGGEGDPRPRPPRARPGGLDSGRGRRARRPRGRRHPRRPGRPRARRGERGRARGGAADRQAQRRSPARVRGARARRASRERSGSASSVRPSRSSATSRVEAIELVRNELVERTVRSPTDERETVECGIVFRSVGYRGLPLAGRPVRRGARATVPNDRRPRARRSTARRSRASTAPAGSSAGRPA